MCAKSIESFGGAESIEDTITESDIDRVMTEVVAGRVSGLSQYDKQIFEIIRGKECLEGVWDGEYMVGQ